MLKAMISRKMIAGACVAGALIGSGVFGHGSLDGHHDHGDRHIAGNAAALAAAVTTSGQGAATFEWDRELTAAMPQEARPHEARMHGGFNEDSETGIVYTGIPGYGLVSISEDLKTWTKLGNDNRLKSNIHGIVVFKHGGETLIATAMNQSKSVLVVGLDGTVKQELKQPKGTEFTFEAANNYYKGKKVNFSVTDVTYADGKLYAVTGYSPGDFVLTAHEKDGKWQWGPTAWGGRGNNPGQFKTAHGVSAYDDHIYVASREAHKVLKFTKDGKLVEDLPGIPKGSRVCNVSKYDGHFVFCPLAPVAKGQKSAPIYSYAGNKVVSTIVPADLGIPVIRHNHHVWPHYVKQADGTKQLYLLVHGWNKGKYAVLKQVSGK